jgi:hypothetical protein
LQHFGVESVNHVSIIWESKVSLFVSSLRCGSRALTDEVVGGSVDLKVAEPMVLAREHCLEPVQSRSMLSNQHAKFDQCVSSLFLHYSGQRKERRGRHVE